MKTRLSKLGLLLFFAIFASHINAQVVINEVYPDGAVELKNIGSSDVNVSDYWLCDRPAYERLGMLTIQSGDLDLSPNEIVVVELNGISVDVVSDEMALYSSSSFSSSTAIVDFVQWGTNTSQPSRESVAVAAGIWTAGDFTPAITPGNSLQYDGMGNTSADYFLAEETLANENISIALQQYEARLTGLQQNPAVLTTASGLIYASLTGNQLEISGSFEGLSGELFLPAAGGDHVHRAIAGRNGEIELQLVASLTDGNTSGTYAAADNTFTLTEDQITALAAREFYINIHSSVYNGGEIRGQLLPSSDTYFQANLLGSNEVPSISTTAGGNFVFELEGTQLTVSGSFDDLSSEIRQDLANGAHIHANFAGRNGPVIFPLNPTYDGDNQGAIIEATNNSFTVTTQQIEDLEANGNYINIHSVNFPAGELRGQILPIATATFRAELTGAQQVPAISSPATGRINVTYDGESTITVGGSFNNLTGDLFLPAAGGIHLHAGVAGTNGGVDFIITPDLAADNRNAIINPIDNTFTVSSAQVEAIFNRGYYINIHSSEFNAGELRGQVLPYAQTYLGTNLLGQNEIPQPVLSEGLGNLQFELTGDQLTVSGSFDGLTSGIVTSLANGIHIHANITGANGPVVFPLNPTYDADNMGASIEAVDNVFTLDAAQRITLLSGGNYINIHSEMFMPGELRGQILRDDNAFPEATIITSPEDGIVNLVDDSATPYVVTWDATTDPDGDLVIYTYQLAADAAFTNILINTNVGTALEYNVPNSTVFAAINGIDPNGVFYQRVLATDGSVANTSDALTITLICEADGGTVAIDLVATGNPNGTTTFNGDTEAVICVDGQMDPIVVIHENTGAEDLSYRYVITDAATGLILNVVNTNSISLDPAGPGTCEIWGWSYRGVANNGLDQIGQPLSSLDDLDCSDISDNAITVIREAADGGTVAIDLVATGNPNGTTTFNGDTEAVICVDGQMDPIVVIHENPGAENLSYRYVITDAATGLILNVVATNSISLDPAGPGTCEIWGWSYRGVANNGLDQIGQPLSSLNDLDCSDISDNAVTVIRETADGGTVNIDIAATEAAGGSTIITNDTEAVICLDADADPIIVAHINDAPNLSYRYVITDAATGLILNVVNTNSIDLNAVAVGTCEIWGWSYRGVPGNGLDQVGQPLSSLDDLDCSDISDNAVTVIRQEADLDSEISIDLQATGNPNGTTTFPNEFEAIICGDSQADPLVINVESIADDLPYTLIAYDIDTSLITNTIDVVDASATLDLNGPDNAEFEIFGVSGILPISTSSLIGTDVFDFFDLVDASECLEFSITSIFISREVADGGTVSIDLDATGNPNNTTTFNSDTEAIICVDGQMDPLVVIHENLGAENLSYRYVITDAATGLILNVVDTNIISLDAAGVGTCEIWGWSYRGVDGNGINQIGLPLSSLDDMECSDISDNAITVIREEANGGIVSLENGDTEITICAGDGIPDPLNVVHTNDAPNLTYLYVVTDSDDDQTILNIGGSTLDLEGAGEGICRIWGWSYRGLAGGTDFIGLPLANLQAEACSDISDNFIEVTRLVGEDCQLLSTNDFDRDIDFTIFPNPVDNQLNIAYQANGSLMITIYDLTGRVVSQKNFDAQADMSFDTASLSSGAYLVSLTDLTTQIVAVKRFVKR